MTPHPIDQEEIDDLLNSAITRQWSTERRDALRADLERYRCILDAVVEQILAFKEKEDAVRRAAWKFARSRILALPPVTEPLSASSNPEPSEVSSSLFPGDLSRSYEWAKAFIVALSSKGLTTEEKLEVKFPIYDAIGITQRAFEARATSP